MAVPKGRTSRSKRDMRRAHRKLEIPGMVKCPQCFEYKLSHRACKECGHYKAKEVISVDA